MGSEGALDLQPINCFRPGPAFRRIQHQQRPARPGGVVLVARVLLNPPYVLYGTVQFRGHGLVHSFRFLALHIVRRPAVAAQQLVQFLMSNAGQQGGVGYFVAVKMQDREHRSVGYRVQEFIGVPRGRQRAGLRLAVADNAGDDQVRIVEGGAESVAQRVA